MEQCHACHVLLTGLVADEGKLRRLWCSQDYFIYFMPVAATSLRAGFQVYLSKLWVVDVTKVVRYDLLIYCLLSDIILYFLLVATTSLRVGFQVYLSKLWVVDVTKAVRYDLLIYCLLSDIILYFLLVATTSLRVGFQVYLS